MPAEPSPAVGRLVKLTGVVVVVAVLHVAEDVLAPLAVAALLSFLLAPLVRRLERIGMSRVLAVSAVVIVAFALVGLLAWVVYGQVIDLADSVTRYRSNIREKIQSLRGAEEGPIDRASAVLEEIEDDLAQPPGPPAGRPTAGTEPGEEPVPVTVTEARETPLEFLSHAVPPLLQPLAAAGIVIVFVVFMLLAREDLRDRLIRLVGYHDLYLTTSAMDEAARRVSSYLAMQFIVNVTYGFPVGLGLALIGVPNALLWGLLATVLRYIPYAGPWIAAVPPILLSFAAFPGWDRTALTVGLFVVLEIASNNFVEPWLYGMRTGVSPVALLTAAVFWTWLWGPVGLMLAAPLTVCLVVVGQHVPPLEFLSVLFGDRPALTPPARLYQRLLARDVEEAVKLVEESLASRPLAEVFDSVVAPALALAERDRHRGALSAEHERFVLDAFTEILDELGDSASTPPTGDAGGAARVLVVAARDDADALVAAMTVRLLAARGVAAASVGTQSLAGETLERVAGLDPAAVLVSALPPQAVTHARYLVKRLRGRFPDLPIGVGLWVPESDPETARERLTGAGAAFVVTTLTDAVEKLADIATSRHFAAESGSAETGTHG